MANYMENFNSMSRYNKINALEMEILSEKEYLENTSQPHRRKKRIKYIKELESQLEDLTNKK